MVDVRPKGPYLYQPYGRQDSEHWEAGRIYGVAGLEFRGLAQIKGLTKEEANKILKALIQ